MAKHVFGLLCHPDGKKSCTACCGLFNLSVPDRESCERFLFKGSERAESDKCGINCFDFQSLRDLTSHLCPYQGFVYPERPGCLMHPESIGDDLRDRSLFGSAICGGYLCPAYSALNERQKSILVRLIDDWYLYMVAIIDPDSFVWMLDNIMLKDTRENDDINRNLLATALTVHSGHLCGSNYPLFYYSVQEYNINKWKFSLCSNDHVFDVEKKDILSMCRKASV